MIELLQGTRVERATRVVLGTGLTVDQDDDGNTIVSLDASSAGVAVQDDDTPETAATRIIFQGAVVSVDSATGIATLNLDSRYRLASASVPWGALSGVPVYASRWPTPAEVGALSASGGTLQGDLWVDGLLSGGTGAYTTAGVLDWNDVSNARSGSGYSLLLGTATNGPGPDSYFHPFGFEYQNKDGGGNLTQFAVPYGDNVTSGLWLRGRYEGTWTSWLRMVDVAYGDGRYAQGGGYTVGQDLRTTDGATFQNVSTQQPGTGYVRLATGTSAQVGYVEWYTPAGTRQGYMGWYTDYLTVQLENGHHFKFTGGNVYIGDYTSFYPSPTYAKGVLNLGNHSLHSDVEWLYLGDGSNAVYGGRGMAMYKLSLDGPLVAVDGSGTRFALGSYSGTLRMQGNSSVEGLGEGFSFLGSSDGWAHIEAQEIVANGWFRSTADGIGLYNNANGYYWFADSASGTWISRSVVGIQVQNTAGTTEGYVYFDGTGFGLLHSNGGWLLRGTPTATYLYSNGGVTIGMGTDQSGSVTNDWSVGRNLYVSATSQLSGAVGIGQAAGSDLLTVNGTARFVSTIFAEGGIQMTQPGGSTGTVPIVIIQSRAPTSSDAAAYGALWLEI